jgi:hypothetical protein
MLDRKRDYGEVQNSNLDPNIHHTYEQDGKYFSAQGYEMDDKGNQIEWPEGTRAGEAFEATIPDAPEIEHDEVEAPEPEPVYSEPDIMTFEIDGEPYIVDANMDNYETKAEIRDALYALGAPYLARDTRPQLLAKLKKAIAELKAKNDD